MAGTTQTKWRQIRKVFFPNDDKPEYFKSLDGLRGLAVLIVLLSHSSAEGMYLFPALNLDGTGKLGVYLFFVLSAYLLDRQIALALHSQKANSAYWINYSVRRFMRIYPLFTLAMLVHLLMTQLGVSTAIASGKELLLHLVLLRGNSIFWSIPVEFEYYLISPFIMWFYLKAFKFDATRVFITVLTFVVGWTIALNYLHVSTLITFKFFGIFLFGTVLAVLDLKWGEMYKSHSPRGLELAGTAAFVLVMASMLWASNSSPENTYILHHSNYYPVYAALWSVVIVAAKMSKRGLRLIFNTLLLRHIGVISFSLYLFHMPVLHLVQRYGSSWSSTVQFLVFFLAAVAVATTSYLFIERPLSKVRFTNGKFIWVK